MTPTSLPPPQPQDRVNPVLASVGGLHRQETQEGILKGGMCVCACVHMCAVPESLCLPPTSGAATRQKHSGLRSAFGRRSCVRCYLTSLEHAHGWDGRGEFM